MMGLREFFMLLSTIFNLINISLEICKVIYRVLYSTGR